MVDEKGFVYIMEVVMISVILMVSLGFLLRPLELQEDWTTVELRGLGESVLGSIERSRGIENTIFKENPSLQNKLDSIFYNIGELKIRYNLRIENSYPRKLTVGFNCTDSGCLEEDPQEEYRRLWETLDEIWMNNRSIDIDIMEINLNEFTGNGPQAEEIDIFFIRGERQLNETNQSMGKFVDFLENGGSIIQFTNYSKTDEYRIQEELFGLTDSPSGSGEIEFRNRENSTRKNYEPSKLFYGVGSIVNTGRPGLTEPREGTWKIRGDNYTVEVYENNEEINVTNQTGGIICLECSEGYSFDLGDEELANDTVSIREIKKPHEGAYRSQVVVWFDYPRSYEFWAENLSSSANSSKGEEFEVLGNSPVMVVNKPYKGKTVWVSTGSQGDTGHYMQDDVMSLLRAGTIWAGPRGRWLKEAEKSPERRSSRITYFGSFKKDIYEPYRVNMELWYSY